MATTLAALYTRYSARLATYVADRLADDGPEPAPDAEDVTQDVWLYAAQLLAYPEPSDAWPVLEGLADRAVNESLQAEHHEREFPSDMARLPATHAALTLMSAPYFPAVVEWAAAPDAPQILANAA